jgi:Ca2+-binding EF-hand superfamily protein
MNKLTITAIFLSFSVVSVASYAGMEGMHYDGEGYKHKGHSKGHKTFSLMDSNNDGLLSKEEVLSFHQQRFTLMDADADGLLTKEEMKNHRQKKRFMRMDSNQDGVISEEEMILSHNKRSHKLKSSDTE